MTRGMLTLLVTLACLAFPHAAMAGKFNDVLSIGDVGPNWEKLPGVDNQDHSLADFKDKSVVVVVFTCNSCPYAVDYEDRINTFVEKHCGPQGKVALVAINVNTIVSDRLLAMQQRAKEKKFQFPYVYDETQQIAKDYGAAFTPEFFVLDKDRKLVYTGAMDDSSDAAKAKVNYVELAVAAALAGKKPEVAETNAVGCRVRYEKRRKSE
jgi:peroxiredoxin